MYVKQLQGSLSSKRFTLHGFRSGAAISMALVDVSLNDIMDHIGWKDGPPLYQVERDSECSGSSGEVSGFRY